jgi:hypothetical protein
MKPTSPVLGSLGQCVYCGRRRQLTVDHVPPRNLFARPRPTLITVPSCAPCNTGASLDDEYFYSRIVMHLGAARHPTLVRTRSDESARRLVVGQARGARLMAGVWSLALRWYVRARLPRAHQPSDAIRRRLLLVSCAGGSCTRQRSPWRSRPTCPETFPRTNTHFHLRYARLRLRRRRHRPRTFGTQSSTTAGQENLPLVDRPTACCIVGGGICKLKASLLAGLGSAPEGLCLAGVFGPNSRP